MSYGPGYVLWKQILRERAERRASRIVARRALPKQQATPEPRAPTKRRPRPNAEIADPPGPGDASDRTRV